MFRTIKLNKLLLFILLPMIIVIGTQVTRSFASREMQQDNTEQHGIPVPIIMYHSITLDNDRCSEYVVSLDQIESDIAYLKENNFTPVFVNDLIRYVNYNGELPDKPVILTFDDGFYNNREYLFGLLKREDIKAVISVVGEYTINASESGERPSAKYSYLSWNDINEMRESGRYEFCNHSSNMHCLDERRGILKRPDETEESYRHALISDIDGMQMLLEKYCSFRPNVFTYPYGFTCEEAEKTIRSLGFEATMGVEEKPNYITKGNSECLYRLNRYNRSGLTDTSSFMKNMLKDF